MSNRNVLLLLSGNTYPNDSWSHHTALLWRELAIGFDELHVVARAQDQHWHFSQSGNVVVHLVPRGPTRTAAFVLTSWLLPFELRRIRPTCIQAQSPVHGGLAAVVFGKLCSIPVLLEMHGEHYLRPSGRFGLAHKLIYRPLAALAFSMCTKIRSLSPEMSTEIERVYGAKCRAKVVEITNRVDLDVFSPPKYDYNAAGPLRIITVGGLNANKNHLELIEALSAIDQVCELRVVGSGPLEARIKQAARDVHLSLTIETSLSHPRLAEILRAQDVFIHFSRSEAVSRAVLEAMAMGLPVVVSPVGFLGGIVVTGSTGIRLKDFSPRALSDALGMLADKEARRSMGEAARKEIEVHHEWKTVFALHRSILRNMQAPDRFRASRGGRVA